MADAPTAHHLVPDPLQGLRLLPPGRISVVANYTTFNGLWHSLERSGRP